MSQGEKRVLFDAAKDGQNIAPKWVAPEDEQEPNESRRYVVPPSPLPFFFSLSMERGADSSRSGADCGHG